MAATERGSGKRGFGNGGDKDADDVPLHAVRRYPDDREATSDLDKLNAGAGPAPDHPDEPLQTHVRAGDKQKQDQYGRPDRLRPEQQDDLLYMKSRRRPTSRNPNQHLSAGSSDDGQQPGSRNHCASCLTSGWKAKHRQPPFQHRTQPSSFDSAEKSMVTVTRNDDGETTWWRGPEQI